jgi:hypothetical protein
MAGVAYRMWFGKRSATAEELDHVEEIVVEQEMDMAWEARIQMYQCLDEKRGWQHEAETATPPFSRVRIELCPGGSDFTPLIDGPVASYSTALSSQPGRSNVTIVVRDDSVLMNRKDAVKQFENRSIDAVVREVFKQDFIEDFIGDDVQVRTAAVTEKCVVQRGTPIAFLRTLAHEHGCHAYVLPSPVQGQKSIGCFLPAPTDPGTLPPLVLLGDERNIVDLDVRTNLEGPQRSVARKLGLGDLQIASAQTTLKDLSLLRPLPPLNDDDLAERHVAPADNARDDPAIPTTARTRAASYAYTLTGRTVAGRYPHVLVPYERVALHAGNHPLSGDWLLTKATHRLTPSLYTQEFEAKSDSKTDPQTPAEEAPSSTGFSFEFTASIAVI